MEIVPAGWSTAVTLLAINFFFDRGVFSGD